MKRSRNGLEGRRPRRETGGNKTSLFRPGGGGGGSGGDFCTKGAQQVANVEIMARWWYDSVDDVLISIVLVL